MNNSFKKFWALANAKLEKLQGLTFYKKLVLAGGILLIGVAGYSLAGGNSQPASTTYSTEIPAQAEEAKEEEIAYTLVPYQGDVYALKKPADWKVTDNLNGIEASDAADPLTGVSGTIVMGAFGEQTPEGHIGFILNSIGASNVKYEHSSDEEQVKERWTGLTWVVKTQILTFTDSGGNRVKAKAVAGVLQGSGQYVAMVSAFQTTPAKWSQWAPTLERIMQTIQITDGARVAGHDKVRLPTAADVKSDSSPLMEHWEYKNRSQDRNSQGFSDAILGQESGLQSPSTGTGYTLPLSSYDPTLGGYRNPDNPSELLIDTY